MPKLSSRAAHRGVPVLCQKPLAPTLSQAESLVAEFADKTRLMVHENWRFRPYYRQVAQWLEPKDASAALFNVR